MSDELVFVSKITRLPLTDSDGAPVGRVVDVVLVPVHKAPPRVLGFVAVVQRRKIFIAIAKTEELSGMGLRLRGGMLDLRHFEKRQGETLAIDDLLDRRVGTRVINDVALRAIEAKPPTWEIAAVSMSSPGPLRRRRSSHIVDWKEIADLFDTSPVTREVAAMRDMHPSDVARLLRSLPLPRRQQLAAAMEDDRLADLLEELPEDEQLGIVENIDFDRLTRVVEAMDPDDAVDFLGEMTPTQRLRLLDSMDPEDARPLRRLLLYDNNTAGGLMTSAPVVVEPDTTVAEVLARLREYELPPALAAQAFVARPPIETPTGAFLGVVGIQRLLRETPSSSIGQCLTEGEDEYISPTMTDHKVAQRLAQYDLLAIPVVDDGGRLLGAVTVDDMLDHLLPGDWRRHR